MNIRYLTSTILTLALCACGGGGSGSGANTTPPPVTPPPTGVTPIDPATLIFAKHHDADALISVAYPDDWMREPAFEPEILMSFVTASEGPDDQYLENIVLVRVDAMADLTSPDVTNIQSLSSAALLVDGLVGKEEVFDADINGVPVELRFMQAAFELDGYILGMLYTAERSKIDRYRDVFRYMVNQIRFGQPVFSDLSFGSDLTAPGKPAVASDGQNFLVTTCRESFDWPYPTTLSGRIVNADRSMGDEFVIHDGVDTGNTGCTYTSPAAIFDGSNFLITYMTEIEGYRRIAAKRITPLGEVLDASPIDISRNSLSSAFEPAVAFDGQRGLVVWHETGGGDSIRGAFVDATGDAGTSFAIEPDLASTYTSLSLFSPEIAYSDSQFMVTWSPYFAHDVRRPPMPIFAQLLDLSGTALLSDPLLIRDDIDTNPRYTQIASDGAGYVVGWIEGQLEESSIGDGNFTVHARRVSLTGELLDGTAADNGVEIAPALLTASDGDEVPKDFLSLSYDGAQYRFFWSATNFDPETGAWGAKASQDLNSISAAAPIVATDAESRGNFTRTTHINAGYSNTQSLVVWPSRTSVEAWLLPD